MGNVGIGWRQPHYSELLVRQPALDFLEVHSENFFAQGGAALAVLTRARADYAISLHGVGLSLGSSVGLDSWHLEQLAQLVERIDPVRVSDHASFARGQWPSPQGTRTIHAADLLPIPFSPQALNVLCANVQQVQDRLQRRFMVENLSAYVQWKTPPDQPPLSESEFLSTLAQRTGCALLIDVSNIYVNARNAQIRGECADPLQSCLSWLDGIAPQHVGEIHLAGHCHVRPSAGEPLAHEIVIDDHGSRVCPAVWQLYQHAVARFGTVPSLIEWDTDVPALDVLLDEAACARSFQQAAQKLPPPMAFSPPQRAELPIQQLADQQQALLATLFDWPPNDAIQNIAIYAYTSMARGLKVYQSNAHALAQRALLAAYPVLAQVLGDESFAALARAFWHAQPPERGDIAQWGGQLGPFVHDSAQLQDTPYLGDLARLEWALHQAASAPDGIAEATSFALLASHEASKLRLQLSPGCALICSDWPIASLWAAHVDHGVSFGQLHQRLNPPSAETALVWRAGLRPRVQAIGPQEQQFLRALLCGHSLGQALDGLPEPTDAADPWRIDTWLAQAVQCGLLLGVTELNQVNPVDRYTIADHDPTVPTC